VLSALKQDALFVAAAVGQLLDAGQRHFVVTRPDNVVGVSRAPDLIGR
jgi:hypothetical protein